MELAPNSQPTPRADFLLNAALEAGMLIGVGETARGFYLTARLGADVIEHATADTTEHASVDSAQHASCGVGLSFTATTLVATAAGAQAIGSLHPGDLVWAYNPQSQKMEQEPILHVWINHDNDLVDLTLSQADRKQGHNDKPEREVIHTNKKHPFLTVEKGFLPVGEIKRGMHIKRADGTVGVVSGWTVVPGVMTMYNLEVAQDHTFEILEKASKANEPMVIKLVTQLFSE